MDAWHVTIVGAVVCLLYGWCLSFLTRSDGDKIDTAGPLIAAAGAVVLTAMAVVNPARVVPTDSKASPSVASQQPNGNIKRVTTRKFAHLEQLTLGQVASEVGVHPDTIVRWITANKVAVPKRKNMQGEYRFSQKDLSLFLEYSQRIVEVKN